MNTHPTTNTTVHVNSIKITPGTPGAAATAHAVDLASPPYGPTTFSISYSMQAGAAANEADITVSSKVPGGADLGGGAAAPPPNNSGYRLFNLTAAPQNISATVKTDAHGTKTIEVQMTLPSVIPPADKQVYTHEEQTTQRLLGIVHPPTHVSQTFGMKAFATPLANGDVNLLFSFPYPGTNH